MFAGLKKYSAARRGYKAFTGLPVGQKEIVFYSEGRGYYVHFKPIIEELLARGQQPVYVTSDQHDPVLEDQRFKSFFVGTGTHRTLLFAGLQARIMIMTMPDLEIFHIKRSPYTGKYVYVHHSMVSTHMIYREEAFDHFDTIFCVGPHHIAETEKREKLRNLKPKELVKHGYSRLDCLIEELDKTRQSSKSIQNDAPVVLIAPSWGEHGLLERCGGDFIQPLLDAGFRVILRPHPQTRRFNGIVLDTIYQQYQNNGLFSMEEDVGSMDSLLSADIMVSDWSGAALEFAFARCKPVVFVDVPRKVNNKNYVELQLEPIEVWVREEIGCVIAEENLDSLGASIQMILKDSGAYSRQIEASLQKNVFHVKQSGRAAAEFILGFLEKPQSESE